MRHERIRSENLRGTPSRMRKIAASSANNDQSECEAVPRRFMTPE